MHVTVRSYLAAGVAVAGAGAIALSPVQPIGTTHESLAQNRVVNDMAVSLAATIDPITPWVDTFKAAANNIEIMHFDYWERPFPIMSSILYNQYTYAAELFNGEGAKIPGQIWNNFQTFFKVQREVNLNTLDQLHSLAWTLLPSFVDIPPNLQPLLDLTTTFSSGQFFGLFSPPLASLVQLTQSFTAVGKYFQEGKVLEAINELINIPANTTNAFLNGGQVLDLTSLVSSLLPQQITKFGISLGGLLTPGGSVFNALDLVTKPFLPLQTEVAIPGVPSGILTSSIDLGKQIGAAIDVGPYVPAPTAATAPAAALAAAPATAAVPAAAAATAAEPAIPADEAPAVPATPAIPAAPADEAPAAEAPSAPADTAAPTRGNSRGGSSNSDNGGNSGARGHRGAA